MAKVIGIAGESGSGKTTSLRNLPSAATFYIDADKKGLNWKGWKKQYNSENKNYLKTDSFVTVDIMMDRINGTPPEFKFDDSGAKVKTNYKKDEFKHVKYLVIDTLNGLMVAEEMRILAMQTGDKRSAWSDLAQNGWALIDKALDMRDDLTVIILCHSETVSDENGIVKTRIKTNGRKLEKLVLESKMSTVIYSVRKDGEYRFVLAADNNTCKVPIGAFAESEIDNDVVKIVEALEDY